MVDDIRLAQIQIQLVLIMFLKTNPVRQAGSRDIVRPSDHRLISLPLLIGSAVQIRSAAETDFAFFAAQQPTQICVMPGDPEDREDGRQQDDIGPGEPRCVQR